MKQDILKLSALAEKKSRMILGLMSGTSLDGLDLALCKISGSGRQTTVELIRFATLPYDEVFKADIRRVFAQPSVDFQWLTLLNVLIAERHADLIHTCLRDWGVRPEEIDILASHGQTVFHAPRAWHGMESHPNATLQIGDGDHLARRTGLITVSDFRQKHLAAGGEGAPLALYGDYFLFSAPGEDRFLLNIGGIANFTFLPASGQPNAVFATDTGPGNTLIDAFTRRLFRVPFDENALLAKAGRVDAFLLEKFKEASFFAQPFPKTTGPELFSIEWVDKILTQYPKGAPNPYDLIATLTRLTADTIAAGLLRVQGERPAHLFLSGGGAHNPLIIQWLAEQLPTWTIRPIQTLGIDGDAKEAVLFAVLANETVAGKAVSGEQLGGIPMVGMGKISFPN